VAITDRTGKVVEKFQYGPYGELLKGEAAVTPFLFNGKFGVMTDENNLYYMRARFYSPAIKRFVNMDVLLGNMGKGQTLNRFAFVTGNPINLVDPFGLIKLKGDELPTTGETTVHANPGPEATPPNSRAEHEPPHIHLGDNGGPRVRADTFEPYSDEDARRMTKKQKKFCKMLSDETKSLIRRQQQQVFKYGKTLLAIITGPQVLSITNQCQQDPFYCLDLIEQGILEAPP